MHVRAAHKENLNPNPNSQSHDQTRKFSKVDDVPGRVSRHDLVGDVQLGSRNSEQEVDDCESDDREKHGEVSSCTSYLTLQQYSRVISAPTHHRNCLYGLRNNSGIRHSDLKNIAMLDNQLLSYMPFCGFIVYTPPFSSPFKVNNRSSVMLHFVSGMNFLTNFTNLSMMNPTPCHSHLNSHLSLTSSSSSYYHQHHFKSFPLYSRSPFGLISRI